MPVTRVVPNLPVADVSRAALFYADLFGMSVAMDLGWVANVGPAEPGHVQLQMMTADAAATDNPVISVGMATPAEVDEIHERALAAGCEIVHEPTDEEWGVHRFFLRDPDGNVVNVVANL